MNRKKLSDVIGAVVIVGFIASFIVRFPMWVNVVIAVLAVVEIWLIMKK